MTVGYKRWVLQLSIVLSVAVAPLVLLFALFALIGLIEAVDIEDAFSWLLLSLITLIMTAYLVATIYLTARELRRSGYALKINRSGLHMWSSTKHPIPWSDINRIEVDNMFLDSGRSIEISLKKKIIDYPSPYPIINLHRHLTFGSLRRGMTISLTGVDCDNKTLRGHIGSYTNRLYR